ncbi:MAG: PAS domain-containing protein [Pseudohongiellaceae bacterium]|nr:PAS domain-containing protein [Pseudohongiellaceae bacterium]
MKQSFPLDQQLLLQQIPGLVYRCKIDPAWTMLYLSDACEALTGYPALDLLENSKLSYASIILPEDRSMVQQLVAKAVRAKKDFRCTYRIKTKSGTIKWVREIGEAITLEGESSKVLQGYIADITREKINEEALAKSQQNFDLLADAMPLIVWTADADGITDYTSASFFSYTGLSEDTDLILSECWRVAIHAADRNMVSAAWRVANQTASEYVREYRLLNKDGSYRWHLSQARPLLDKNGDIIKWYGATIDIHHQRMLLQDARRLANRLVDTLESITDAFMTVDHDWRVTYLNGTAESLLNIQRDHLIGKNFLEEFPEASEFVASFKKAVEDQTTQLISAEYKPLHKWFDARAFPSADGLAIYFRDATQQRAMDNRLKETQHFEALGQLTGGVAHDFNNLLTVIVGNAEVLNEGLSSQPELQGLARMVQAAADRGAELTRRLLAFARKQALEPQVTRVSELVKGMENLMRQALTDDIELKFTLNTDAAALIDPVQLESALLCICANSRDAMPNGGTLTVETSTRALDEEYADSRSEVSPGEYVVLSLSDSGSGIPSTLIAKVFDPFFTTKGPAKGSGLGLSMVYGFVKQSNGHISLYSEIDEGTTVTLYLPLSTDVEQERPREMPKVVGGTETVLLVEDDDLVREYAKLMLAQLGYKVLDAPDGIAAMEIVNSGQEFDLLLTDVIMPGGMNGAQLAEAVLDSRPNMKVLFMSGYTEQAVLNSGRLQQGVTLLSKPFQRAELAAKIREVLDH